MKRAHGASTACRSAPSWPYSSCLPPPSPASREQNQLWTAARAATLTGRESRVFYSVSGGTRLLHRFGPRTASRRTRREGRHRAEDKRPDRGDRARAARGGYICFETRQASLAGRPWDALWADAE
ncbi:winged helix-turn-helix domain-containing protein [Streptomyces sp. NPDC007084]|uniref:winged helix-turn-helix domain-containing protein n=1 Tax=Streptomyces sp. NPDC007084 TaxID=3154313 RepID=UPI0034564AE6